MIGSFSVEYVNPDHPDEFSAVDWDHWEKDRWIRSWKGKGGSVWHREDGGGVMDRPTYMVILEKFGLTDFAAELPLEKIQWMSPSELMRYREVRKLPRRIVTSDTPGDHRTAMAY